jgi:magnesium chelatase subunit D
VGEDHVLRAARYALSHRRRRDPLDRSPADERELEQAFAQQPPEVDPHDDDPPDGQPPSGPRAPGSAPHSEGAGNGRGRSPSPPPSGGPAPAGESRPTPLPARVPGGALALAGSGSGPAGRRGRKSSGPGAGAIDSRPASAASDDVAVVATLRARLAGAPAGHMREHVRAGREGALLCLVVDASGSMGARRRLARVKGALLREAYARRDRVAVVCFRDSRAHVLVAPGAPLERAAAAIRALPTGGRTPLAAGLDRAAELLVRERSRERARRSIAIVFTDGRVSDPNGEVLRAGARLARAADAMHMIDTEDGPVRLGLAGALAAAAGASVHTLHPSTSTRRAA